MGFSKQEHIEHFKRNEKFLKVITEASPDAYFDWHVTVCFYCALHLVRAFLVSKGVLDSNSHHHTLSCIDPKEENRPIGGVSLPNLHRPYLHLYLLSRNSRYDGFLHAKQFDEDQREKLQEAQDCLTLVKAELARQTFSY